MPQSDKSFIETQFPVSLISKETLKEGDAKQSQTLTGLGKWWGRKELILIRASILGMLMPASSNPPKDREIFLKILTMDADGLWQRRSKSIPAQTIADWLPEQEAKVVFEDNDRGGVRWIKDLGPAKKEEITRRYFDHLSYDEKLEYCDRPEQIEGPSKKAWLDINAHLGTTANNIQELIGQLGKERFGRTPRVGDAFCGGGSIPFEAARLGCEVYGSDLNPVAAALTWSGLNLVHNQSQFDDLIKVQEELFERVDQQIIEWGIENNENGWRANAYLYCTEVTCPSCNYSVPLANSWAIAPTTKVVAKLIKNEKNKNFDIDLIQNASIQDFELARSTATLQDSRLQCPSCNESHSIDSIRSIQKLRDFEKDQFLFRGDDVFRERLFAIRWEIPNENGRSERVYKCPDVYDKNREEKVIKLLSESFVDWQSKGFIPSGRIDDGAETTRLRRERGWCYWHHLFTPRQLLVHGLISSFIKHNDKSHMVIALSLAKAADWDSRLCRWGTGAARESIAQTFYNQAFNPFFNYAGKGFSLLKNNLLIKPPIVHCKHTNIDLIDARDANFDADLWITDPPYADAVNYHELTDFFLAWYDKHLEAFFPEWKITNRQALAVKGRGQDFKISMIAIYRRLALKMPANGLQMVQFTHQDPSVWADLGMILWVAGLQVSAAWTVSTETSIGVKSGNYVRGTVLLVLRKRATHQEVFPDELPSLIEDEVCAQLDEMTALDDKDQPIFGDTDYQLAAYAAALRVMTQFSTIEGINVENELFRERQKNQKSAFEKLIDQAIETACNYLIPKGFDEFQWKGLAASERLYLKGLELEKHGELRAGAYQELAKGFGVREYAFMFAKTKANEVRFKTGTEFKRANLGGENFAGSLMRHVLFALHETVTKENAREGVNYLRTEVSDFWGNRKKIIEILRYLNRLAHIDHMPHWEVDAEAAQTLAGAIENFNA
jgi:putative DNA methylase